MTFDNPHGTPAFRAHTTLHRLATARIGVDVSDVARARDLNVLFRDHESEGGDAAAATLAGCAMAYQGVEVGQRRIYGYLQISCERVVIPIP